jgi:hypothetical protein
VRPGGSRWAAPAAVLLGLALLLALPLFAAAVVRHAIEADGAAERAAFAAGGSPWSWRFREPDDVVAGRSFGGGRLEAGDDGLHLRADGKGALEVGLPFARPVDLTRLDTLRLRATASAAGTYALLLRESLTGPLLRADMGALSPNDLGRPVPLRRLAWTGADGRATDAPARAAMLRLQAMLPAGATLVLDRAWLGPSSGRIDGAAVALPRGASAEGLLDWRDRQWAADPLRTFGEAIEGRAMPAWVAWLPPCLYFVVLCGHAMVVFRRRATPRGTGRGEDLLSALLVLAGPLWLIAGLGLPHRPESTGMAMFLLGVAHAMALAMRGALPSWQGLGSWRGAGWPLAAIVVALALVLLLGHTPAWPPAGRIALYLGWALFQQWLILAVVGALLARALPRPWAVVLTALAFALLHTPNGLLMQLCFVAELGWAWWYFRHRALLPVAVAHATSAVLLQAGLAGGVLRSLEVSARFLN